MVNTLPTQRNQTLILETESWQSST